LAQINVGRLLDLRNSQGLTVRAIAQEMSISVGLVHKTLEELPPGNP
jgi:transcriptional regulator with XRE-family HTH domain